MIRVVHPGSGSVFFTHPGSRIQGSKRHRIPDPQHCLIYFTTLFFKTDRTEQTNNRQEGSIRLCCGSGCFWTSQIWIHKFSKRYGSGFDSGPFYHQAKIVRKTLIPTALWFLYKIFIFENWCKCSFKKLRGKKSLKKKICHCPILKVTNKNSRIRIRIRDGSVDPDPHPYQNITDPQHWYQVDHRAY